MTECDGRLGEWKGGWESDELNQHIVDGKINGRSIGSWMDRRACERRGAWLAVLIGSCLSHGASERKNCLLISATHDARQENAFTSV